MRLVCLRRKASLEVTLVDHVGLGCVVNRQLNINTVTKDPYVCSIHTDLIILPKTKFRIYDIASRRSEWLGASLHHRQRTLVPEMLPQQHTQIDDGDVWTPKSNLTTCADGLSSRLNEKPI